MTFIGCPLTSVHMMMPQHRTLLYLKSESGREMLMNEVVKMGPDPSATVMGKGCEDLLTGHMNKERPWEDTVSG